MIDFKTTGLTLVCLGRPGGLVEAAQACRQNAVMTMDARILLLIDCDTPQCQLQSSVQA